MPFWTSDSDSDTFSVSDSSVDSCFKYLRPLLVFWWQISMDVGPMPLWSIFKLFMVLHRGKSWFVLMCYVLC